MESLDAGTTERLEFAERCYEAEQRGFARGVCAAIELVEAEKFLEDNAYLCESDSLLTKLRAMLDD